MIVAFFPAEATEEECKAINRVSQKAEDLMHELKAYEEIDTNLMLWFQNKYKEQKSLHRIMDDNNDNSWGGKRIGAGRERTDFINDAILFYAKSKGLI